MAPSRATSTVPMNVPGRHVALDDLLHPRGVLRRRTRGVLRECCGRRDENERNRDQQGFDHRHSHQAFSAASTRAGVNGTRRMRTPVASNTAFATAAIIGLQTVSPAP